MRIPMAQPFLAAALLIVATAACSDTTAPAELAECDGPVAVSVGGGTTPEFTWEPSCRAFFLLVEPAEAGGDQWSVMTPGDNDLAPGITYGTVPAGAEELDAPVALVAGTAYEVLVFRHSGPDADDGVLIGTASFTP